MLRCWCCCGTRLTLIGTIISFLVILFELSHRELCQKLGNATTITRLNVGKPYLSNPILKVHHRSATIEFVCSQSQQIASSFFPENSCQIIEDLHFFSRFPGGIRDADTNGFVTPTDVFLGFLYRKKLLELLLRNELSIGPVPGLTLERGEGLLKGARESNGTVIKQAADLNARVNAGTLLLGIPAIAVGADIDTTGRVLTGHQGPRFAGIVDDLRHIDT